jgi:hypothetical protein
MLGDFGDAMSDITEDEDEMTQEKVRGHFIMFPLQPFTNLLT